MKVGLEFSLELVRPSCSEVYEPLLQVVRRRPASAQGLLARVDDGKEEHIEVIHQRNYHKLDQGECQRDFRKYLH